jgi:hypothetical protein
MALEILGSITLEASFEPSAPDSAVFVTRVDLKGAAGASPELGRAVALERILLLQTKVQHSCPHQWP